MLFKFTCFWRTNSYSLVFRFNWHSFQNQSCVKASHLATIGEFGRFPIYNHICESISKFYLHVKGKESDSLLNQTLQTSIQLHKDGFKSWYSGVEVILNELNLNEENICSVNPHLNILCRKNWTKNVNEEAVIKQGKLRTYALFKSNFQKEVYLETVKDVQEKENVLHSSE